jgi:DNA mismatch repair protein MutS2
MLAQLAASDLGRERLVQLAPLSDRDRIKNRQTLVSEARRAVEQFTLVPYFEEPLRPLLDRLVESDSSLSGTELIRLSGALMVVREAEERIRLSEINLPSLASLFQADDEIEAYCQRISKSLDRRGRVRDNASPKLGQLRKRIQKVREGLYKSLQQELDSHKDNYSETTVSLKDGRLNLLLNAGAKGRSRGLIHGRSGTGQSFYFEPLEAVEANNALQEALDAEIRERQRILNELIDQAREHLDGIRTQLSILADLDALQSASRYAEMGDCSLPTVSERVELQLIQARHPLLDPVYADLREGALGTAGHKGTVVPLDLELDAMDRILVITGPNAGGKTVALKTTGLLALIAQCGLPIPAGDGSRVTVFDSVMAMVGDEQDLLADRSTFSARLIRLGEAWEVAGPASLVLLDEMGSGTDPEEGAALAIAVLEGLLESESLGVITTHLTQLSAVALERDGATCAAMEFDPDSGEPTYRLRPGAPGASEALALAERLGLPRRWIKRAEELLGGEHRDLRRLLQEVEKVRQELGETQGEVVSQARELEREKAEVAGELDALKQERKIQQRKMRQELDEFRRKVTQQLRDELATMQNKVTQGRRKNLVGESLGRLFESEPEVGEHEEVSGPIEVGQEVRHRSLRWQGVLEKVKGEMAEVRVRGKKLKCNLDDLTPVGIETTPTELKPAPNIEIRVEAPSDRSLEELNLIGHRVEPALEELDSYLDQALLGDRKEVRIVHGFGSGRLRSAVRQYLKPHPAVHSFRAGRREEGGDGATVVVLDKK